MDIHEQRAKGYIESLPLGTFIGEEQPSTPQLTVPLHLFLNEILHFSDKITIDPTTEEYKKVIADIKALPCNENIHHCIPNEDGSLTVWHAKDWRISQEKVRRDKEASEKRVESWNLRTEIKEELKKLIEIKMGNVMGVSESFSENILGSYNIGLVLALGGTQDLCNKILELQQKNLKS